jgi:hypothetical protein
MARQDRIGSHKTRVYRDAQGRTNVQYWNTDVVSVGPKDIDLNTGGWKTNTTKTRMNQASREMNLGYGVYQRKGAWYAQDDINRMTIPFREGRARLRR